MKTCNRCKEEKSRQAFSKDSKSKDGLQGACKECQSKRAAEYYQANKEAYRERSSKNSERLAMLAAKRRYGIEEQEYKDLARECEVCGRTERLHIDHCHETGKIRGRLCSDCNTALGLLKEDITIIEKLKEYIMLH